MPPIVWAVQKIRRRMVAARYKVRKGMLRYWTGCDLWKIVANEENGGQLVDRPNEVREGTSWLHLRFCDVVRYEVEEGREIFTEGLVAYLT